VSKSSPKPLVAVDSMILVWAIRKEGPADLLERAKLLFYQLDQKKHQIVVPTIVVAEYLSHVPWKSHAETIELMRSKFYLPPFDIRACSLAAEIFQSGQSGRGDKATAESRKCLRADSLIVATAKTQGVKAIYSHDRRCRNLAEKVRMAAYDLPVMSEELPFP
jgi:predicted nucleic acid-binding protein